MKSVADQMEAFLQTAGGDGFMLSPIYCPGAIEEFVDLVVPELQRRGLMRREYRGPHHARSPAAGGRMNEPAIVVTDTPEPHDVEVIVQGLSAFNGEHVGASDRRRLAVLVKDAAGTTVGGISGSSSLGLLFIDLVYLPKALRGGGLGSRMLAMAEEEGRRRGCRSAVLYTLSFQAPDFYKRHGWRVMGEIECDRGASRIFMTKKL